MANRRLLLPILAFLIAASPVPGFGQGLTGSLRDTNGRAMAASEFGGRVSVLMFGGLVDPQSPDDLPVLQRLADKYSARGVAVYWVSLDPANVGDAQLAAYAAKHGYSGPVLRDTSGDVLRSAGGGRRPQLPTFVVLGKDGAVADAPIGGFDRDSDVVARLSRVIEPLLR